MSHDISEGDCDAEVADLIRRSLSMCTRHGRILSFPSLLLSLSDGRLAELREAIANSADLAAGFFYRRGFRVDRTRMNNHGYPGLFRDLTAPPPWVEEVALDDFQPLFRLATDLPIPALLARYQEHLDEKQRVLKSILPQAPETVTSTISQFELSQFEDLLKLARCIGSASFKDVASAVFAYDEFPPFPGAPDLFVWLPDSQDNLWFFAEVKAPGDSLRESQRNWLKSNWELIRGRFVQVILE